MNVLRSRAGELDVPLLAGAAATTIVVALTADRIGAERGLLSVVALAAFGVSVWAFLVVPHVAMAAIVPVFVTLPLFKVLVSGSLGPLKDVLIVAAVAALAIRVMLERRLAGDRVLLGVAFALMILYAANLGGLIAGRSPDAAWGHGVRLVWEPLLLLVVGLNAPDPRRTFRWLTVSVVATSCIAAGYGLVQQLMGQARLAELGYSYGSQIRTIGDRLRSFGTLDEPFGYAALLLVALAVVMFTMRRRPITFAVTALLLAGLAVSYVRTAAIVAAALAGLMIARRSHVGVAALFFAAAAIAAIAILLTNATGTESTSVRSQGVTITFNGRTDAWKVAFGPPSTWPLGQGVGKVGTAAARAAYSVSSRPRSGPTVAAVDSGYLATLADTGLIGLALLLGLLLRIVLLAIESIRVGRTEAWVTLGIVSVLMLDAVTRSSFTGFPNAYIGMMLIGVTLATAASRDGAPATRRSGSGGPGAPARRRLRRT